MVNSYYNARLTLKLYILAAVAFGFYGGHVSPVLNELDFIEFFIHISITFGSAYLIRHFLLRNHPLTQQHKHSKIDATLMFLGSLFLVVFYTISYHFSLGNDLEILFGMTLFGFLTGYLLQIDSKMNQFNNLSYENLTQSSASDAFQTHRRSMLKQMTLLISLLLIALTTMLTMVVGKDIFWLEHHPDFLSDGRAIYIFVEEFIYISLILGGYVITIMMQWSKLIRHIIKAQEHSLIEITHGNLSKRLPVLKIMNLAQWRF